MTSGPEKQILRPDSINAILTFFDKLSQLPCASKSDLFGFNR